MSTRFPIRRIDLSEPGSPLNPNLWNIPDPPSYLYIQGSEKALDLLGRLPGAGLAIVGTREPQTRSVQLLREWIPGLAGTELVILSGFARGIDGVAHRLAVESKLPTIAILAAGLSIPYPRQNQSLRDQILESDGLLVSEFPLESDPRPQNFLRRNRLISGWSQATLVVQASEPSGALNTARWAREQNRTTFAVPSFPGDPYFSGNQKLLDDYHALPCWGVHSLGAVWLALATYSPQSLRSRAQLPIADEEQLTQEVRRLTLQAKARHVHNLLDWGIAKGWEPQRFFLALKKALQNQLLLDENGLLLKKFNSSV